MALLVTVFLRPAYFPVETLGRRPRLCLHRLDVLSFHKNSDIVLCNSAFAVHWLSTKHTTCSQLPRVTIAYCSTLSRICFKHSRYKSFSYFYLVIITPLETFKNVLGPYNVLLIKILTSVQFTQVIDRIYSKTTTKTAFKIQSRQLINVGITVV